MSMIVGSEVGVMPARAPNGMARRVRQALCLIAASLTYVVAKSCESAGEVTIANVEFFLLGLLPFGIACLAPYKAADLRRTFIEAWVGALLAFIILTTLGMFEEFRIAVLVPHGLYAYWVYVAACSLMSILCGLALPIVSALLFNSASVFRKPAAALTALLTAAGLFPVLVFIVPA